MSEHPIEGLMLTAMNSIKDMVNVDTIIGDPIQGSNNIVIIPISKVSFGFAAGGSEFKGETIDEYNKKDKDELIQYRLPFGGGAGAGVTINPTAFLVIQDNMVKLLPVDHSTALDKILDYIPDLIEKTNCMLNKKLQDKKEATDKIISNMKKRFDDNKMKTKEIKNEIKEEIKDDIKDEVKIQIENEIEKNDINNKLENDQEEFEIEVHLEDDNQSE